MVVEEKALMLVRRPDIVIRSRELCNVEDSLVPQIPYRFPEVCCKGLLGIHAAIRISRSQNDPSLFVPHNNLRQEIAEDQAR